MPIQNTLLLHVCLLLFCLVPVHCFILVRHEQTGSRDLVMSVPTLCCWPWSKTWRESNTLCKFNFTSDFCSDSKGSLKSFTCFTYVGKRSTIQCHEAKLISEFVRPQINNGAVLVPHEVVGFLRTPEGIPKRGRGTNSCKGQQQVIAGIVLFTI